MSGGRQAGSSGAPLDVRDITAEEVARRLSVQLRKMVGPGRRWSYRGLADLTGIDTRSLKAYAAGTACPNLAKFKRLLSVLGPELARDIDRMYGWVPRDEVRIPGPLDLDGIRERLAAALEALDRRLAHQPERVDEALSVTVPKSSRPRRST